MPKCPICEARLDGINCQHCGYDASLDYENHPTVTKISFGTKSNNATQKCSLSPKAQYQKGAEYFKQAKTEQNPAEIYKKAFEWYSNAANLGYAPAQCEIGWMYANGYGVEKNEKEAFAWYVKAAQENQNCPRGKALVGECYLHGKGVSKNDAEGVRWYEKAAEEGGDPHYQRNLAMFYLYGVGVRKNRRKAKYWMAKAENSFTMAAERGNVEAQVYLGMAYESGDLLKKNLTQSFYWYQKAAEQGYSFAQYKVGEFYTIGYGVKSDVVKAIPWYHKAAKQGNERAIEALENLRAAGCDISL